jgi:gliding motility-associated-like protein
MKRICVAILLYLSVSFFNQLKAQSGTYILNGTAAQNTCNCYTLTQASAFVSGSVWNANKINLNNSFDFVFNVYLGCKDADGADGMVFMLQPISTSIGSVGGGMGFQGVSPSIGISLDTWQNTDTNDPAFDHISIQANGNNVHGSDLSGPYQASAISGNIEDCRWHTLRITWDATTHWLRAYFDNILRVESQLNLISAIFNNDPMVYWGFSAATGGSNNLQQFCTALNPLFTTNLGTDNFTCIGNNTILFSNNSQSFAPIANYYWDFDDGTTSTAMNPPAHTYTLPGAYNVKMAITGFDGCNSDTLRRTIIVGDYPLANFDVYDTCSGKIPRIIDRSTVSIGTISRWNWIVDGNPVSTAKDPQLTGLAPGLHTLQLEVRSEYGCASAIVQKQFTIAPSPVITATVTDGCINIPVQFNAAQTDNATTVTQWNWQFGNGLTGTLQNPLHTYNTTGNYTTLVTATAGNGCTSNTISLPVFINRAIANAGNDTTVIKNEPFQLNGSGGQTYSWSPDAGLNNSAVANPVATLEDDQRYTLTVTTAEGCTDTDDIAITVFKGSAIYVPTGFTPNGDGINDVLKPYYIGIKNLDYLMLYNRWGQVVFSSKNMNAGWDGTIKGVKQLTGVFIWRLRATDFVGKVYEMKGTTTLVK